MGLDFPGVPQPKKRKTAIPSALNRGQQARQVIARLQQLQEQELWLSLIQSANDHAPTDEIPGADPVQQDGKIVYVDGRPVIPTYAEENARLQAAAVRVMGRAAEMDVVGLVEKMLAAEAAANEDGPVL